MKSQLEVTSWPTASRAPLLGVIFTSVALFLTPCTALGQNQGPRSDLDSLLAELTERLVLSEEQVAQVRPMLEQQFQKQQELVQRYRNSGNPAESQRERDELRQATHERLSNVLTERQMAEYHAMRQEQQRATGGRGQGRQAAQAVERSPGQDCQCGNGQCGHGQCTHGQCGHGHGGHHGGCKRG